MRITPLDRWIAVKIGVASHAKLRLSEIRSWQLERIRQTIQYARERSPFYRERLAGSAGRDLRSFREFAHVPFTTAKHVRRDHLQFLCVSQSMIERVVTLLAPDPSDEPRKIYFTAKDLELTVDFFHRGMSTLVDSGQCVLILMPGERPWSVGDMLVKALERMNARGIVHGPVKDPEAAIEDIISHQADCLVAIPSQALALARHPRASEIPGGAIKTVLLSADYVPQSIAEELQRKWNCRVFSHYGTTETGLGGGVECEALDGLHLREADLYFEIVDPESGRPLPPGARGEVVFTTLNRKGMPLIRYRTGDLGAFHSDPCPCGTELPRIDKIAGRLNEMVRLATGDWLGIHDMDEIMFRLPEVLDYRVTITEEIEGHKLKLEILPRPGSGLPGGDALKAGLLGSPQIKAALKARRLEIEPIRLVRRLPVSSGAEKRSIIRG